MSNVTTFKFNKRPVRIVEKDGCKFFVIRDICDILGFSNPNRQLAIHTENVEVTVKTANFLLNSKRFVILAKYRVYGKSRLTCQTVKHWATLQNAAECDGRYP